VTATPRSVVVVGGGIAGLTAAFELAEAGCSVTLVEANDGCGGKIVTSTHHGLVVEGGADAILSAKPAGIGLVRRLGLEDRLIDTRPDDRRTFVWWAGRLRALPEGLVLGSPARAPALLRSGLLSPRGAARMAKDIIVPPRRDGADESIAEFFTRRLGLEAYARVVEPLLAGIHAGDATQLSLAATFPRFVDMERNHGGLVRAAVASRGTAATGPAAAGHTPFVSLQGGMGELTRALEARLDRAGAKIVTGCRVAALRRRETGWDVEVEPAGGSAFEADAVVLATPAPVTATLLRPHLPEAAALLDQIPHASTATVSFAYQEDHMGRRPAGFGFVVPRAANRRIIAATYSSKKWTGRAPEGTALVRGYVGGIGREDVLDLSDGAIIRLVEGELAELAGITGVPTSVEVHRYPSGMPQYTIGHLDRVARIRQQVASLPGLAVAGATYAGVGIPDCISDATAAARSVASSGPVH
jgi:oxygen-dependent protoporphyrinogen oxidase